MTENENGMHSQQNYVPTQAEETNPSFPTPLNDVLRRIVNSNMILNYYNIKMRCVKIFGFYVRQTEAVVLK